MFKTSKKRALATPLALILTLAVFVHSLAFIDVVIYTLHRLCSM